MKNRVVLSAILLAASAASTVAAQQLTPPTVNVYRVLQVVNDTTTTVVQGMFRVDPALLGGAACDYTAEIEVRDARGTSLRHDKWDGACPVQNGVVVPALEMFRFGMPAGETFTVDVAVNAKDKPKERHVKTLKVNALADKVLASDLILARKVGLVDSADSAEWNIRRGAVGLRASSEVVVEAGTPALSYYLELYPRHGHPVSGTVLGIVKRKDNAEITRFQLQKLDNVEEFRPIAGTANLAGLAAGDYNLEVQVALTDTTITRVHPFTMVAEPVVVTAGSASTGFFANVSDEDMERKYGSAAVWLTQKAQSEVFRNLTPSGKREYLNRLFGPEIPNTQDGKETSAIDAFVTRSETVANRYGERAGRGTQPGWQTDRGRIYMLHGEPNSLISRPSPQSGSPYEIFHYQTGKGLTYLFADETRMGHFRLIWTNDPEQQGRGNGLLDIGPSAQEDLKRLGVRVSNQ
jgi:GWxTD domain-containing protein